MFENEKDLYDGNERRALDVTRRSTFLVVDWDDTLLPTTWMARNGISLESYLVPASAKEELERLDRVVAAFLQKASVLYANVMIITNAQPSWVELSSKRFMPETHDVLFANVRDESDRSVYSCSSSSSGFQNQQLNFSFTQNNEETNLDQSFDIESSNEGPCINVFSARGLFEKDFPNDPSSWKRKAFEKLLKSRISSKFFIQGKNKSRPLPQKAMSDSELETEDGRLSVSSRRGLKRSLSDLSISTIDLSALVEVEDSSFEIETEFKENDSFFSVDFASPITNSNQDLMEWEYDTKQESNEMNGFEQFSKVQECCNLISIGDCHHDCESLRVLDIGLKQETCLKKTIKFIQFPSVSELLTEVEGLQMCLDKVVKVKKDLDLMVTDKRRGV